LVLWFIEVKASSSSSPTWWRALGCSSRDEGERLERIEEDGLLIPVELPAKLRGEHLRISPLQDGWTVAVARYVPKEPPREECCHPWQEPEPHR
jgi:hypothetical protein